MEKIRLLDLGCGPVFNGTGVGMDIDYRALAAGQGPGRVCGRAECLPFPAAAFDRIISGVAFPYFDIPKALDECSRVLAPGGGMEISVHSWRYWLHEYRSYVRQRSWKSIVYKIYVLLNGLCFWATGRLFRLPGLRIESIQSVRGMRLAGQRSGLELTAAASDGTRFKLSMRKRAPYIS